jgi:microcystin degradation protein MlrC
MRIAIAQIIQETHSFNPNLSDLDYFYQAGGLYFGDEVLEKLSDSGEIGGFVEAMNRESAAVAPLPVMAANGHAYGTVTATAMQFFEDKLVSGLKRVLPIDGLFLSMHGAAASQEIDDVEGTLLAAARRVVGDDVPIVVPLDHHANITRLLVDGADAIVGYQTEPHDPFATGERAARILFRLVKGELSPAVGWYKIPMMSWADRFMTGEWPMKEWFDLAREMETRPGVVSASTFPMQPWLDVAEAGWTAIVYTEDDPALARALAAQLANKAWELREAFWAPRRVPPEEVIKRAIAAQEGPIIISDPADASGAPGDSNCLLKAMLRLQVPCTALVPIVDAEVVDQAMKAGVGSEITVQLGGKLDPVSHIPVEITAKVAGVCEEPKVKSQDGHGYAKTDKTVFLQVGNIQVVVSEGRAGINHADIYRNFGIEPEKAKMIVVKMIGHFGSFRPMMKDLIFADCPGWSGDLRRFAWNKIPHPMYPFDEPMDWRAEA